jgi:uncharacterized membrane protein YesL
VLLLNVLWLLTSLGVVTVFGATAAAFAVVRGWRNGGDRSALREFRREFVALLRPATVWGLMWTAVAGLLALDVLLAMQMSGPGRYVMLACLGVVVVPFAFVSPWLMPSLVDGRRGREIVNAAIEQARSRPLPTMGCWLIASLAVLMMASLPVLIVAVPALAIAGWALITGRPTWREAG